MRKRGIFAARTSARTLAQSIFLFLAASCSSSETTNSVGDDGVVDGYLKRIVISNPDDGTSQFEFFLERPSGQWLKLATQAVPEFAVNREVSVSGELLADGRFSVTGIETVGAPSDDIGEAAQALITPSPKKVALLLFNFTSNTAQPLDAAAARTMLFTGASSSNAYFKEISFGARSLVGKNQADGDVIGWYTIENSTATCDYSAWGTAARAKAQAAGVDLGGYDNIVHYFPKTSSCGFSGVAQLPGRYSWINGSSSQTTAHELGHNFGVHHASSYICTQGGVRVPVGGTCTLDEYGDPFDVMGRGYRHMNAYQKGKLGWLEAGNTQTVAASGDFAVVPLETKSDGVQSLRVGIPGTTEFYYVEYRQIFGFDSFRSTDPVVNGVLIHRATDYTKLVRPALVDTAPSTTTFTDAALGVGKTFTDGAANLSITLLSRTASSASVRVSLGGGGGGGSGGAPGSGGTTGSGGAGGTTGTGGAVITGGTTGTGGVGTGGTGGTTGTGGVGTGGTGTGGTGPVSCAAGESLFDGRCYFVVTAARSNAQSQAQCTSRGAGWHLATVGSAAENAFVASLAGSSESWIGGGDSASEGRWVWATGETFWTGGLSGAPAPGAYANFLSGEPNNSGGSGGSDCLRIVSGGGWRDVACSSSFRAICEKN